MKPSLLVSTQPVDLLPETTEVAETSPIRWVVPKDADIETLRTLVREEFSVTLTEEEARELALRTLHLVQFLLLYG